MVTSATFKEYAEHVFIPYIRREHESTSRLNIVWDKYVDTSLKATAREKRGHGGGVRVTRQGKVPKKWPEFLRDSKKPRRSYSSFSEKQTEQWPENKVVCVATGDSVAAHGTVIDELCSHEEGNATLFGKGRRHLWCAL